MLLFTMKLGGNVSKGILFFSRMDKNGCFVVVFPFSFSFLYAAGTVYCHLSCDHIRYSGINDAKTFGFEKISFFKKVCSKEDLKSRGSIVYPRFFYREQNGEEINVQR